MEIKIGVQQTPREIVLESEQSPEDIEAAVRAALADGGILTLEDDKGRRVIVPADRLAYVDISPATSRRVGFGT
ncbi:MAG: DUF3107 domain-containing protein [Actinobacteria bacterium]|nr:DUF3107 domain-containing protein [Actinomycetota bacterium]